MVAEKHNKIGILGGTFNPVHIGHLILAQNAMEAIDLSKVLFIPCAQPPHKAATALVAAEHRVAMLEAAIEDDLRFEICDIEIKRAGPSYSIDTVTTLKKLYPETDFYFIIGGDSLLELHLWKDIDNLLRLCKFVTFARPGAGLEHVQPKDLRLDPPWAESLLKEAVTGRQVDVSSSDIRHRVAEGMSIRYLVPRLVEIYIAEHNLYVD
jgi:nicotinate-nucleotide adenylyltransferase